jgi:hypothetical protein
LSLASKSSTAVCLCSFADTVCEERSERFEDEGVTVFLCAGFFLAVFFQNRPIWVAFLSSRLVLSVKLIADR